jgi:outer membrane lipoprotein-sorting protein
MMLSQMLKFLVSVALFALSFSAHATELTLEQLRAKQSKLKSFESMTIDFVQTKFKPTQKRTLTRKGQAVFKKPERFVWKLETPTKEYNLYDGKDFYTYLPDDKTAVKYSITGPETYQLRQVVDLVLNFEALLKRYDLEKAEQVGDDIKVILKPKAVGDIASIDLGFSEKNAHITYLKMTMASKVVLAHDFSNPVFTDVPDSAFGIPAGVKVSETK